MMLYCSVELQLLLYSTITVTIAMAIGFGQPPAPMLLFRTILFILRSVAFMNKDDANYHTTYCVSHAPATHDDIGTTTTTPIYSSGTASCHAQHQQSTNHIPHHKTAFALLRSLVTLSWTVIDKLIEQAAMITLVGSRKKDRK